MAAAVIQEGCIAALKINDVAALTATLMRFSSAHVTLAGGGA